MTGVIYCSDLALKRKASDENLYLKTKGALALNLGDLKLYVAQGTATTDTWKSVDGATTITPVIMPETTALSARWAALGTPRTLVGSAYESPIDRYLFTLSDNGILSTMIYLHLFAGPYQNAAVLSLVPAPSTANYDGTESGTPVWAAVSSSGGGYTFGTGQSVTLSYSMNAGPVEGAAVGDFCIFGFVYVGATSNAFDHQSANGKAKLRLKNQSGAQISMGGTGTLNFPFASSVAPHFQAGSVSGSTQYGWDEGQLVASAATSGTTGKPDLMQYGGATATNRQLMLGGATLHSTMTAARHLILRNASYELMRGLGVSF